MHIVEIRLSDTGDRLPLGKAKNLMGVWKLHLKWLYSHADNKEIGTFQAYDLAPEHEVERITNGQRLVWSNGYTDGWNWHRRYA